MIQSITFILVATFSVAAASFNNYGNGMTIGSRRGIGGNRRGGPETAVSGGNGQVGDLTFLANVTDPAVRTKFQALYFNHTLNETTRAAAVDALVSTLDSNVQAAYAEWKDDQAQKRAEREVLLEAQIANLTALTDQLHDGVYALKNNASLSNEEKVLMMPSEFEKLFKGMEKIMNDLFYVGGSPHPEDGGEGEEYPNYPEYPGNYPDYGGPGGPGGRPGRPGSVWPPRGGPRGGRPGPMWPPTDGPDGSGPGPAWPPRGGRPRGIGGPNSRPGPNIFPGDFDSGMIGGPRPNPFDGF